MINIVIMSEATDKKEEQVEGGNTSEVKPNSPRSPKSPTSAKKEEQEVQS